jgi:hypothetical protein
VIAVSGEQGEGMAALKAQLVKWLADAIPSPSAENENADPATIET